jgi:hypothetical protein
MGRSIREVGKVHETDKIRKRNNFYECISIGITDKAHIQMGLAKEPL